MLALPRFLFRRRFAVILILIVAATAPALLYYSVPEMRDYLITTNPSVFVNCVLAVCLPRRTVWYEHLQEKCSARTLHKQSSRTILLIPTHELVLGIFMIGNPGALLTWKSIIL